VIGALGGRGGGGGGGGGKGAGEIDLEWPTEVSTEHSCCCPSEYATGISICSSTKEITDIVSTDILWHVDPLLGNNCKISN
jgi:hypothetical protein